MSKRIQIIVFLAALALVAFIVGLVAGSADAFTPEPVPQCPAPGPPSLKWNVERDGRLVTVELKANPPGYDDAPEKPYRITVKRNRRYRRLAWNNFNSNQYVYRWRKHEKRARFRADWTDNETFYWQRQIGERIETGTFGGFPYTRVVPIYEHGHTNCQHPRRIRLKVVR